MIEITKAPKGWMCTVCTTGHAAIYSINKSIGICQEMFDAIRAYQEPEPRYWVEKCPNDDGWWLMEKHPNGSAERIEHFDTELQVQTVVKFLNNWEEK